MFLLPLLCWSRYCCCLLVLISSSHSSFLQVIGSLTDHQYRWMGKWVNGFLGLIQLNTITELFIRQDGQYSCRLIHFTFPSGDPLYPELFFVTSKVLHETPKWQFILHFSPRMLCFLIHSPINCLVTMVPHTQTLFISKGIWSYG